MDGEAAGRRRVRKQDSCPELPLGAVARGGDLRLRCFQIGALPLVNHYLRRLQWDELLRRHLPRDDPRQQIPTSLIVLLLVRNVLVARQPLYGVPAWAARHAPDLFELYHEHISALQDDRLAGSGPGRDHRGRRDRTERG